MQQLPSRAMSVRVLCTATGLGLLALVVVPGVSRATTPHSASAPKYYVSLGDSYSVGYQPAPVAGATAGYTAVVAKKLKMTLVNFGCGGATTDSILTFNGVCGGGTYGPPAATDAGSVPAGDTQVQAAVAFITAHPGQIGLITVSIGGNDVTSCASAASPVACVEAAESAIQTNVTALVGDLSAAAGSSVPIVGLTYPDVLLGLWVYPSFPPSSANQTLAEESVAAFQDLINPTLSTAYTSVPQGKFVDVTTATGAYTPLTKLKTLSPYGKIPKAVAEVCKLTWYCALGNIHAKTVGYDDIGKLIVKAVKKK
jgi:lysophospholipase L1-like esterase